MRAIYIASAGRELICLVLTMVTHSAALLAEMIRPAMVDAVCDGCEQPEHVGGSLYLHRKRQCHLLVSCAYPLVHLLLLTGDVCTYRKVNVAAGTVVTFQITDATSLSVTSDPVTVLVCVLRAKRPVIH